MCLSAICTAVFICSGYHNATSKLEVSVKNWKFMDLSFSVHPLYLFYVHGIHDVSFVTSNFVEITRNKEACIFLVEMQLFAVL